MRTVSKAAAPRSSASSSAKKTGARRVDETAAGDGSREEAHARPTLASRRARRPARAHLAARAEREQVAARGADAVAFAVALVELDEGRVEALGLGAGRAWRAARRSGGAAVEKSSQSSSPEAASIQSVPSLNSSSKSSPSMSSTWSSRPHSAASRPSSGSSVKRR